MERTATEQSKLDAAFEQSLIDVVMQARDGRGLPVRLLNQQRSAAELRSVAREFARPVISHNATFMCFDENNELKASKEAEAAAWDNLALLARATAAALRASR